MTVNKSVDWNILYKQDPLEKIKADWVRRVWKGFKEFIPEKSKVLEIGCGTGKFVAFAAKELDCNAVGIDINSNSGKYAAYLAEKIGVSNKTSFFCGDGFCLPFKDESFDVVMSEGVIEHFTRKQEVEMLKEHRRVCKKNGIILASVPNLLCLPHTICKIIEGRNYHVYPEKSHSYIGLYRLFNEADIKLIKFRGFNPSGFVFGYRMKYPCFNILAIVANILNNLHSTLILSIIGIQILGVGKPKKRTIRKVII